MSDGPADVSPEGTSKVDEIKAQAKALVESVKTEVTARLDQLLDEIGAII